MEKNIWRDGIFGVVVGDALGCPVEFEDREVRRRDPVSGMREYGTFHLPRGSWTDDSSLTLALLASLAEKETVNLPDIMERFSGWLRRGEYTPFGRAFDVGRGTHQAINRYAREKDVFSCGGTDADNNGNGSLMRIMPACLYCYTREKAGRIDRTEAIKTVHEISALTHAHFRSMMACGLYYFMVCSMLDGADDEETTLTGILEKGISEGMKYYSDHGASSHEMKFFRRLEKPVEFAKTPEQDIRSTGYVIDTLEAAVWCFITTGSYAECTLKAVNLGLDTDTVAAIAGGLAGLYYGMEGIPESWLNVIQRREWIEELCQRSANWEKKFSE